jgi:hypothetical protein
VTETELTWTDNSTNEHGFRIEYSRDSIYWSVLTTTPPNVTTFTAWEGLFIRTNLYRVLAVGTHDSAFAGPIAVTSGIVGPLPAAWASEDVGSPSQSGTAYFREGLFRIDGGGAGIARQADQFHYVYQPWTGDGEIVAFFEDWAFFLRGSCDYRGTEGLMFRQSLDADAAHAHVFLTYDEGVGFQARTNAAASATDIPTAPWMYSRTWVRLTRRNNLFTAYASTTGTQWTALGSATVPMSDPIFVGMAVSSHGTDCLQSSVFREVSVASPKVTLRVSALTNGILPVTIEGQRNLTYTLEASTNLIQWWRMESQLNVNGTLKFSVNPYPPGASRQFYRVVTRP